MKHTKIFFAAVLTVFLTSGFGFAQDTTLTVTEAGNLGIGTTAPTEKVQIGDFGNGDIYMAIKSIGGNQARNGLSFSEKVTTFVEKHLNVH